MPQKFKFASFRNAQFRVAVAELEAGKHVVNHEFPGGKNFAEDPSKKTREWPVEGYIVGDTQELEAARDRLIAAVEAPGPGVLLHPMYGQKNVQCVSCRLRESVDEQRMVRVSLVFIDAGEAVLPSQLVDTKSNLLSTSDTFGQNALTDFINRFTVNGAPGFVVQSAIDKIKSATAQMNSLKGSAAGVFRQAADLAFALRNMDASATDLVNNPEDLASQFRSAFQILSTTFDDLSLGSREKYAAQTALLLFGADDDSFGTATSNRAIQEQNRTALNDLVKRLALEQVVNTALELEFSSLDDAISLRDELFGFLDDQEAEAADVVFESYADLRAGIHAAIPAPEETLPNLVQIKPLATTNSIVLAYELYGSLEREQDIIDRNKIEHPGFIMGGRQLEVIANV